MAGLLLVVASFLLALLAVREIARERARRRVRRRLACLSAGPAGRSEPAPAVRWGSGMARLRQPAAAVAAALAAAWLLASPVAGALVGLAWPLGVRAARRLRERREREAFQAALPGALERVARALRAGQPIEAALLEVARSGPAPVGPALGRVREDLALGAPFGLALHRFAARHRGVPEVQLLVSALVLGRETGGQLADLLDGLARTVRRRVAFRQELAALLAEGRATAWVLGLLPAVFLALMAWLRPGYLESWLADPAGRALLALAAGLELTGFACMRLLTRVEP